LKLIYDAAHSFGVKINGNSILNYGDLSILSFHATKVFNTIEGGAIISPDEKTKKRIDFLKNFGFVDETTVIEPGINAKMNELQAAFGFLQLKYIDNYISRRRTLVDVYRNKLINIEGLRYLFDKEGVHHNYSYFPILIDKIVYGMSRDEVYENLKKYNIYCRRYFYPLISQFPTYKGLNSAKPENLPNAEKIAQQIICLPLYPNLDILIVNQICKILKKG
jgi:dTDP-4-amino-4,6-dideoxygalactose transaminase